MSAALRLVPAALVLAAIAVVAAPAAAAPKTASARGEALVLQPVTVYNRTDLDFGTIIPSGAGTAILNPYTGAVTTTGLITAAGGTPTAARFTTTGSRNSVVIVKVPNGAVTLTRVGGGATMTVTNWTLDGNTNRRIPLERVFDFYVGGTLNVGANQLEGTYTGTFNITVNYP